MFKPSSELENDIANKNILHIRDELTTIIHEDRGFYTNTFDEALKYIISKNIDGLFVTFDNEVFKPEEEWDRDYWAYLTASLLDNFCMERINHLKEVGRKVYPRKTDESVFEGVAKKESNENEDNTGKKYAPIVAIACLAGCTIAIGCAAIGVAKTWGVAKILGGAAVIAGGVFIWEKGKK